MLAQHPFLPKTSRLVLADYVTMDSGTGCVHTAPGFGADDYQTCMRYGMDMVVPVDDQGRHTDYAGKYAGHEDRGVQPRHPGGHEGRAACSSPAEDIVHSYPHCWRCKNPIIFRATPQWFCSVESFKDEAVAACDDVRWVPAWGMDRMNGHDPGARRLVHLPPAPLGPAHPRVLLQGLRQAHLHRRDHRTPSPSSLPREGSNAWFEKDAADILPEGFTCPHCGQGRGFTKEDGHPGRLVRLRLHPLRLHEAGPGLLARRRVYGGRWTSTAAGSSPALLTAVGALGQGAPFKECITHGWTVDGEGKAMHKSLGNGVDPDEIIKKYGADLLRLWAGLRRLPRGRALLEGDLQAAEPELPEVPQHRPVLPGQPGRL